MPIVVGPGLNFCGPAADCNGTDPYQYLKDFTAACTNCQIDHIAVHWYDNFPSLRAYIESNASLAGWVQFGKPIWLTEFSLNGSATAAQQEAFMREAIPYLESQPNVFRYCGSAPTRSRPRAHEQRRHAHRARSGSHQPGVEPPFLHIWTFRDHRTIATAARMAPNHQGGNEFDRPRRC